MLTRLRLVIAAVVATTIGAAVAFDDDGPSEATAGSGPGAKPRPNVILIVTDDQNLSDMSVMPKTTRKIGGRGVTFTNSFATYPLCCPARATLLTGQYAHNHGVLANFPPLGGVTRFDETASLGVSLDRAGYRTAFVGKYLNGYFARAAEDPGTTPPGWDRWFAVSQPGMFGWEANDDGTPRAFGGADRAYQTDVLAGEAKRFIRKASRRRPPFFLTLMTQAPHTENGRRSDDRNPRPARRHRGTFEHLQLPEPPSLNEADVSDKPEFIRDPQLDADQLAELRDVYRGRLESLIAVDELVEDVVDRLRRSGELRNTYLIFTSDNGFLLGEHRQIRKRLLYEEAAHVPLLLRGPGLPRGVRRPQITGNVDIATTILDIADVRRPAVKPDGTSLLDVVDRPRRFRDRVMLLENRRAGGADGVGAAVRTRRWVLIEQSVEGETYRELYNLHTDPYQLESKYEMSFEPGRDRLAGIRRDLGNRLEELRDCRRRSCP